MIFLFSDHVVKGQCQTDIRHSKCYLFSVSCFSLIFIKFLFSGFPFFQFHIIHVIKGQNQGYGFYFNTVRSNLYESFSL